MNKKLQKLQNYCLYVSKLRRPIYEENKNSQTYKERLTLLEEVFKIYNKFFNSVYKFQSKGVLISVHHFIEMLKYMTSWL